MTPEARSAITTRLTGYDQVVEIGIGNRTDILRDLSHDSDVTATDIYEYPVPTGVRFVIDDITEPTMDVYANADLLYALNLPPELHHPTYTVATDVDATFVFTTLGNDPPSIPVTPEQLHGDTLFWARQ